jgi:hypothetical protein
MITGIHIDAGVLDTYVGGEAVACSFQLHVYAINYISTTTLFAI